MYKLKTSSVSNSWIQQGWNNVHTYVYLFIKLVNLGIFWRALEWKLLVNVFIAVSNILWRFVIFYVQLVYFMVTWYILWSFGIIFAFFVNMHICIVMYVCLYMWLLFRFLSKFDATVPRPLFLRHLCFKKLQSNMFHNFMTETIGQIK
jgi:hypothetical protein